MLSTGRIGNHSHSAARRESVQGAGRIVCRCSESGADASLTLARCHGTNSALLQNAVLAAADRNTKRSLAPLTVFQDPDTRSAQRAGPRGSDKARRTAPAGDAPREMIEVILNDRLGKKIRVKCK